VTRPGKRAILRLAAWIAALTLAALPAVAETPGKIPHVGYLWFGAEGSDEATMLPGFRQGLRELGYQEGGNIVIEYRYAGNSYERLHELVAETVASRVDVILAVGVIVADAVKQATTTIPVVVVTGDPLASGLVASLARPGGNITGFSFVVAEFGGKWVEFLHELAPHATRIAMLWNPLNAASRVLVRGTREAAGSLGIALLLDEVGRSEDLPAAFAAVTEQAPDALIMDTDAVLFSRHREIIEFAAAQRLPTIYGLREFAEAGGLISYGPIPFDIWRRVAGYVDKILNGAKPADLPVEQPTKFELVINLKTAKALGLTIPSQVLGLADEVIE
jgi:putative tryptophan/tyrosine transport system substrate-binding protein